MERKWWEDSSSSNFEFTPFWLQEASSDYGLNPGVAHVSGGFELDAVGAVDELAQQIEHNAVDFASCLEPDSFWLSSGIESINYSALVPTEVSENDPLLGERVGVNQDIELFDHCLGNIYGCSSQRSDQIAFENGFERGFEKGFEKGLSQQPRSTIFQNVQFAGGFAEFVGGDMVGGSINNLSPFLFEKWKTIEKELLNVLDSLSFSSDFEGPEANIHRALGVLKEISKNSNLCQNIVDFKGALRVNGLLHQSTNPVINIVIASF